MYTAYTLRSMNTAVVNIKVRADVKKQAQKVAEGMGLSLSTAINGFLKHFVKTKTITFGIEEEPSEWMIKELKKSKEDIKAGRVISFKDWQEEFGYLNKLIDNDKKSKRH